MTKIAIIILLTLLLLSVAPVLAADPMPLCPPIGMAGERIVYRCVDEDEGNIIYMNELGFMFVVEW
jgi:hypothetical protein